MWLAKTVDGAHRRETTLGAADDALDADGQRVLDYAQAQAKARDWLASLHGAAAPGPYTINRCLDDYIADYKRRGGKALDRLEITVNVFIRPQLGAGEIEALTAAAIRKWHLTTGPPRNRTSVSSIATTRTPSASANRIFGVLKAALNLAFREGNAKSDEAWRRVKPFREASAPKIRYLTHAEAQRLVNVCEPGSRPLVQAALLTGCRYGELVAFRASDFDRAAGTVSVRASKAGRLRHVVLTEDGITLFERHVAGKLGHCADLSPTGRDTLGTFPSASSAARRLPPGRD